MNCFRDLKNNNFSFSLVIVICNLNNRHFVSYNYKNNFVIVSYS